MDKKDINQAAASIRQSFDLESAEEPQSEEALLELITQRVSEMMEGRLEQLLSLLYRMDVLEVDIKRVLHPSYPEAPNKALARLVLERQKKRIEARRVYKTSSDDISDDWKW